MIFLPVLKAYLDNAKEILDFDPCKVALVLLNFNINTSIFTTIGGLVMTPELNEQGLPKPNMISATLNNFYQMASGSEIVPRSGAIVASNNIELFISENPKATVSTCNRSITLPMLSSEAELYDSLKHLLGSRRIFTLA